MGEVNGKSYAEILEQFEISDADINRFIEEEKRKKNKNLDVQNVEKSSIYKGEKNLSKKEQKIIDKRFQRKENNRGLELYVV